MYKTKNVFNFVHDHDTEDNTDDTTTDINQEQGRRQHRGYWRWSNGDKVDTGSYCTYWVIRVDKQAWPILDRLHTSVSKHS